jgi:hypothetical protein
MSLMRLLWMYMNQPAILSSEDMELAHLSSLVRWKVQQLNRIDLL